MLCVIHKPDPLILQTRVESRDKGKGSRLEWVDQGQDTQVTCNAQQGVGGLLLCGATLIENKPKETKSLKTKTITYKERALLLSTGGFKNRFLTEHLHVI